MQADGSLNWVQLRPLLARRRARFQRLYMSSPSVRSLRYK